jgi:maltose alpha-D-glucosyltransferase/alpha-amylase
MEFNDDLLQLFIVEKAAYELCYELANRPDWVDVPLRGLLETIDVETGEQRAA